MKGRTTFYLFISVVVLGGFIYFQDNWKRDQFHKAIERAQVFGLDTDTLSSMQFVGTNGVVVDCVLENDAWMTSGPGGTLGRADVAMLSELVSSLNLLAKGTTITANQLQTRGFDASEYGFDKPRATISARDNTGAHRWVIGRKTPLGDMVYVRYEGDENVYTTHCGLLNLLPSKVDQFRDRSLFAGAVPGIRRLELSGADGLMEVIKDVDAGWLVQQPIVAKADPVKVASFLEKLYQFRVEEFEQDNVSDFAVYGLQGDAAQIALEGSDGSSRTLMIGDQVPNKAGFVFARRADDTSVFTIKESILELVQFEEDDFRDRQLMAYAVDEVTSVAIAHGADQLVLNQGEKGHWSIAEPVRWEADADTIMALLKAWNETLIGDFFDDETVDGNEFVPPAPEWVFEFGLKGGETNRIEVLPQSPEYGTLLVRRDQDASTYLISLPPIPDRVIDPLAYKHREVLALDASIVNKIVLEKHDQEVQELVRQGESFAVANSANSDVVLQEVSLKQLLSALSSLNATGFVAYNPADLSEWGLTKPVAKLQLGVSDVNQLGVVLLFGSESKAGVYAMVQGRDVVFVLGHGDADTLTADLVKRKDVAKAIE